MKNKVYIALLSTFFACTMNGIDPENEGYFVESNLADDAVLTKLHDAILDSIATKNFPTTRSGSLRADSKQIEQIMREQAEKYKTDDKTAQNLLVEYVSVYGWEELFDEDGEDREMAEAIKAMLPVRNVKTGEGDLRLIRLTPSTSPEKNDPDSLENATKFFIVSPDKKIRVNHFPSLSEAAETLQREHKSIKTAAAARKKANIKTLLGLN